MSCFWYKWSYNNDTIEKGILTEAEFVSSQERPETYHHPKAVALGVTAMEDGVFS